MQQYEANKSVNKTQVAERFSAASTNYDRYAQVQKQIAQVNLELLTKAITGQIRHAVDLGCGTGIHTKTVAAMSQHCMAMDISPGMLRTAKAQNINTKTAKQNNLTYCAGDADSLPIQSACVDVLHSSMALQWCLSPKQALSEIARVLSNNGTAQLAIMLDSSLIELRQAWENIGVAPRVNQFFDQEEWLQAAHLIASDYANEQTDTTCRLEHQVQCFVEWHPSSLHMLRALKRIGAATKNDAPTDFNSPDTTVLPASKPIRKDELVRLDQEMHKHLSKHSQIEVGEQAQWQPDRSDVNHPLRQLPLSYQVLFLTIHKTQSKQ